MKAAASRTFNKNVKPENVLVAFVIQAKKNADFRLVQDLQDLCTKAAKCNKLKNFIEFPSCPDFHDSKTVFGNVDFHPKVGNFL